MSVIPTLIAFGLVVGLFPIRSWGLVVAILVLGTAWGVLVAVSSDAYFPAGFTLGAANAAIGVVFAAGLRSIGAGLSRRGGVR